MTMFLQFVEEVEIVVRLLLSTIPANAVDEEVVAAPVNSIVQLFTLSFESFIQCTTHPCDAPVDLNVIFRIVMYRELLNLTTALALEDVG